MDPTAAYRLAIRVLTYVEQRPDRLDDYHVTANFMRVVDKDTFNWMGFHELLGQEIVHGHAEDNDEDDANADDDWGESDEIEYVGVDDEKEKYKDVLNDDGDDDCDYYPDTDPEDDDPLVMDDERGYEGVVHVTDIDNPKIAVGVTFEDGFCFKRCIRQ